MLRVVVLDASALSRSALVALLEAGGHQVVFDAGLNDAAVAKAVKTQPQILCIDLGDPDDGMLSVIDTLKTQLPKCLIFLVSGRIDATTVQLGAQKGVNGFIVKPFNAPKVLLAIKNAILKLAQQRA